MCWCQLTHFWKVGNPCMHPCQRGHLRVYSGLPNNCAGWNKRAGWIFFKGFLHIYLVGLSIKHPNKSVQDEIFKKKRNKVCCTIIRGTRIQLSDVWVHNNLVNIEYRKTQNSAYFSTEIIWDQRQRIDRIHTLVADPLPKYCVKQIYSKHAFVYHVSG